MVIESASASPLFVFGFLDHNNQSLFPSGFFFICLVLPNNALLKSIQLRRIPIETQAMATIGTIIAMTFPSE